MGKSAISAIGIVHCSHTYINVYVISFYVQRKSQFHSKWREPRSEDQQDREQGVDENGSEL